MSDAAAIRVESIRCTGFRGLDEVELRLHPKTTVLVGRNNAGKSRLLRALALAVNAVPADRDDLTVDGPNRAYIDLVIAPANEDGSESFETRLGSILPVGSRQTLSEEPFRERISWRTTISRSNEGFSANATRQLKRWDNTAEEWRPSSADIGRDLLRLCRGHLIETGRDLASELRQRGTAAHRLIDDLELDPAVVDELQVQLDDLSAAIVASSRTFQGISSALGELASQVDAIGEPRVRPVPGRVNDLSTVASIELRDGSGQELPLRLHGTGARSLASLRLQGVLYERRLGADGGELRPHALTLVEEPEAHLHPQAQFDLPRVFDRIPGQVIVTTHSTHVVSEVDQEQLRILIPTTGGIRVTALEVVSDPPPGTPRQLQDRFYVSEMEKLRRGVERPFGELLFASAVVMGDGATERSLLPVVLRHALGDLAHGLCVVDPGSMNDPAAIAVVKAARLLGIPWYLFADGDDDGSAAIHNLATSLDLSPTEQANRVVQLPNDASIEELFVDFDPDLCRAAIAVVQPAGAPVVDDGLRSVLGTLKGSTGRFLGEQLAARYPMIDDWPEPLVDLVRRIELELRPPAEDAAPKEDDDQPAQP